MLFYSVPYIAHGVSAFENKETHKTVLEVCCILLDLEKTFIHSVLILCTVQQKEKSRSSELMDAPHFPISEADDGSFLQTSEDSDDLNDPEFCSTPKRPTFHVSTLLC